MHSSNSVAATIDVSCSHKETERFSDFPFVTKKDVLSYYFGPEEKQTLDLLLEDRGKTIAIMTKALQNFLVKAQKDQILAGVIGFGGSGGTSLVSTAFKSLPLGVPKVIVSTIASGHTELYIGTSDLILFPLVVNIYGINTVSRVVLSNTGDAVTGMVIRRLSAIKDSTKNARKLTVGITMFGITTPSVNVVRERLEKEGYETMVFHATGVGGRALEDLVKGGFIQGVLDITTTEVADYVVGGLMACDISRFDSIIEKEGSIGSQCRCFGYGEFWS